MTRLKNQFKIYAGSTPDSKNEEYWNGNVVWVTPADFKTDDKYVSKGAKTLTEAGYASCNTTLVPAGSLVVSKRAPVGTVAIAGTKLCTNQGCLTCVPKAGVNSEFYYYVLSCMQRNMESLAQGTTFLEISAQSFANMSVPAPSTQKQADIAIYLREHCSSIDSAISKHQQIIEKLEEYRRAVITQAVTKGLNPNAKMDDDHHEGLGAIPTHWKYERIKYLFTIRKRIAGEEGYTVLSITQHGIVPKDIDSNKGQIAADYSDYQLVYAGDFAMNHMDLLTGWVDISNYDGVTSPDYRVFTINDETRNDKRYFKYLLQMCYFNRIFYRLGAGISGMGRWRLQAPAFNNFKFPVPPLAEQAEIANYIDHVSETIDTAVSQHNQLISKLQEYKQSLIYNAVTGKIDCTVEAKA